jgi:hypothetical protein
MKPRHYVIHVIGCVEPQLRGPYETGRKRDLAARHLRNNIGNHEDDGYFSLDIDKTGKPTIDSYSNGFMEGLKGFDR